MNGANQTPDGVTLERQEAALTEDLFVRNYDVTWSYDLDLVVTDDGGDVVFDDRFYLRPGETVSKHGLVPTGEYEVTAVLDNQRLTTRHCQVGEDPDDTILVELGNGIVSVAQGLYRSTHSEY